MHTGPRVLDKAMHLGEFRRQCLGSLDEVWGVVAQMGGSGYLGQKAVHEHACPGIPLQWVVEIVFSMDIDFVVEFSSLLDVKPYLVCA